MSAEADAIIGAALLLAFLVPLMLYLHGRLAAISDTVNCKSHKHIMS